MTPAMDSIHDTFYRLSLSKSAKIYTKEEERRVIIPRIIPCAAEERIMATVKGILAYSIGRRTFTQAIEAERVTHVLHLLFRADRMDPDNARTITYILLNFMLKLGEHRMGLAIPVYETVVREIQTGFGTAWTDAIRSSEEVDRGNYDLSRLKYFSALLSDLYAVQILGPDGFIPALDTVLALVNGPVLTKILIYEVMSRAMTSTGPKLPPSKWAFVRMKWVVLSRENRQVDPVGRTMADIGMFVKDAEKRQRECGVPFIVGTSEDLEVMCQSIAGEAFELRRKVKLELLRVQAE